MPAPITLLRSIAYPGSDRDFDWLQTLIIENIADRTAHASFVNHQVSPVAKRRAVHDRSDMRGNIHVRAAKRNALKVPHIKPFADILLNTTAAVWVFNNR